MRLHGAVLNLLSTETIFTFYIIATIVYTEVDTIFRVLSRIFVHGYHVYCKIMVFRDVTPCSLIDRYSRFWRNVLPFTSSLLIVEKHVFLKRY
jgi:hypothetical protein